MSNLDVRPAASRCGGEASDGPVKQLVAGREVPLGESTVATGRTTSPTSPACRSRRTRTWACRR